jgi:YtcA-like protein
MAKLYVFTYWGPVRRGSVIDRLTQLVSAMLLLGQAFCSTGCGGAPSVTIAGAYFPAWLLCAVIAVLVAAFIRGLMVATRVANYIPYQLAVCCSAGTIVALILWHFWVAH